MLHLNEGEVLSDPWRCRTAGVLVNATGGGGSGGGGRSLEDGRLHQVEC